MRGVDGLAWDAMQGAQARRFALLGLLYSHFKVFLGFPYKVGVECWSAVGWTIGARVVYRSFGAMARNFTKRGGSSLGEVDYCVTQRVC